MGTWSAEGVGSWWGRRELRAAVIFQDCRQFYTRARRQAVRQVEEKHAQLQPGLRLFFEDLPVVLASVANITTTAHSHP